MAYEQNGLAVPKENTNLLFAAKRGEVFPSDYDWNCEFFEGIHGSEFAQNRRRNEK